MSSVGIIDCEFLFNKGNWLPNLEAMQVFEYYYQKGDIVTLLTNLKEVEKYKNLYMFKEFISTKIKDFDCAHQKVTRFGLGFLKNYNEDSQIIKEYKPNYLMYDINKHLIKKDYQKYQKAALVRIENNNYIDISQDKRNIYVVDQNPLYTKNLDDFLKEYGLQYNIHFAHTIRAKTEAYVKKYIPYILYDKILIDFAFSQDFFEAYYYENVVFDFWQYEDNLIEQIEKNVNMILYAKSHNKKIHYYPTKRKNNILYLLAADLIKWNNNSTKESFAKFMGNKIHQYDSELYYYPKLKTLLYQNIA